MMFSRPITLLTALCTLTFACTGEQSYTPISDDLSDTVCKQVSPTLDVISTEKRDLDSAGEASWNETLSVTLFSETEMRVETQALTASIPAGSVAIVSVKATDTFDLFTDMVFAIDVRPNDTEPWEPYSVKTDSGSTISWFSSAAMNGQTLFNSFGTYALCDDRPRSVKELASDFDFSSAYEIRMRVYPFDGVGSLEGEYGYSMSLEVR